MLGSQSQALWYLTRGFGLVDLVLLTATLVIGLTQVVRYASPGLPRFVIAALHKNLSLLAVVFLAIHVITAVADSYAPISIASVFVPFVGAYRPLWLGLGALALDLLLALVVTSLLRERIGYRAWKVIHGGAYLCWPVAIVHGLGTGSDTRLGWVLAINALCVVAGVGAIWWRLASGWGRPNAGRRTIALGATFVVPLALAIWTLAGPLRSGWARRSGTPAALLAAAPTALPAPAGSSPQDTGAPSLRAPLAATFTGTQREARTNDEERISLVFDGSFPGGSFAVVLTGRALHDDEGVELTGSQVSLGSSAAPSQFTGHVTNLDGNTIVSVVRDASGQALTVTIRLTTNDGNSIAGTINAS